MNLLDTIPYTLFRSLASPSRRRNIAALEALYKQFYDDYAGAPNKNDILGLLRETLGDIDLLSGDEEAENGAAQETIVFNRLRDDGWLEEFESGRVIEVNMSRAGHALFAALKELGEELKVNLSAEAGFIDSGLQAAYDAPAKSAMNVRIARRQAGQLHRSISGVLSSLRSIESDLMKADSLADLLTQFMESFVEKLLLENYRALKGTAYNPMRFQRSIIDVCDRFINDDGRIREAALALLEQGAATKEEDAAAQLREDLQRVRDVFNDLTEKLDAIERFSHKLERRIATTVRYQESSSNVKEEALRAEIKGLFDALDAGQADALSPFANPPVPYSPATLASPRKAREPVEPTRRRRKELDPVALLRDRMMDDYAARMTVTPRVAAERLSDFATSSDYRDLSEFAPVCAQDIAILYELRAGGLSLPGKFQLRRGEGEREGAYISGPSMLIRLKGDAS
ncbi:Wadjet anti-phage system protein JetA family protein [Hyphococcus sp.]|uniref:Wadjet anti-phage system protein JetA family protein n=1 Tax=Hyphococcus sp. TaxID=2038636 RepID=UPI003D0E6052